MIHLNDPALRRVHEIRPLLDLPAHLPIHEAGHVVVGIAMGFPFRQAEIREGLRQEGRAVFDYDLPEKPIPLPAEVARTPIMRDAALRLAVMYMAGLGAELLHAGRELERFVIHRAPQAAQDFDNASRALRMTFGHAHPLGPAQSMARHVLKANWDIARHLAAQLEADRLLPQSVIAQAARDIVRPDPLYSASR